MVPATRPRRHARRGLYLTAWLTGCVLACAFGAAQAESFVTFESGQVRPLALSPDGSRLYAVNTPDGRLEVFDVLADGLRHTASVPVGMEPVAVAVRPDSQSGEVWVVNHLSDSISIVDTAANPPRLVRTLLTGDEPRDIVFAGNPSRAFVTAARRGQNTPYNSATNPGDLTTPGIGRADVWVFDAQNPGAGPGGAPLTILTLFTDTPRALAVDAAGGIVYAAGFHTGNRTTAIPEGAVCNGGATAPSCSPGGGPSAPGGLPAPNRNVENINQPETGLILRFDGTNWIDELSRIWNNQVRFNLPDRDVFAIDANANPPAVLQSFSGVGTILYNMAVNPANGKVYVSNTEARNEVRFEGTRPPGSTTSSVIGHLHEARITVIAGANVQPRHLNKHIDYSVVPAPPAVRDASLALPMGMAIGGPNLYVAAFGSGKIGVFDIEQLETDSFIPSPASHIPVSGGGPSGLVYDNARNRLYVLTRFDNGVSVIDTATRSEIRHLSLHNPEPPHVVQGRPFLYDARLTSSNGEAACASCHVFGDFDSLAWDLGDPEGVVLSNPNPNGPASAFNAPFHPMKGPMTTQSLRGLANHGPMHWRGDRTAGHSGGDPLDENGAFREFNVAFVGLLGRDAQLDPAQMQAFADFALEITYPPNPIRSLDNSLTPMQQAGRSVYLTTPTVGSLTCNACHVLSPQNGFFGSSGLMSNEAEPQFLKIPHLRNLYQKVGMFGMARNSALVPSDGEFMGEQVRGFGFLHDGSVDTLQRFHSAPLFVFPLGDSQRQQVVQFMFAFDSNLAPVVGQQITLDDTNAPTATPRIDLLVARAAASECDLVVKGLVAGQPRGWLREFGSYRSDRLDEPLLNETQLRALAQTAGQALTYTCVPPGSGVRAGIDRDEDSVLDGDDNCPARANADQADGDGDARGNVCDNCTLAANTDQRDTNGDGYGNRCDPDLNNDHLVNFADLGILKTRFGSNDPDADFNGDGFVNFGDLGIMKQQFGQSPGPSALLP